MSGVWTERETNLHLNVLECNAVLLALLQVVVMIRGSSVLVATDNTTTLFYINKNGGDQVTTNVRDREGTIDVVPSS
jgi:hypothetical protein